MEFQVGVPFIPIRVMSGRRTFPQGLVSPDAMNPAYDKEARKARSQPAPGEPVDETRHREDPPFHPLAPGWGGGLLSDSSRMWPPGYQDQGAPRPEHRHSLHCQTHACCVHSAPPLSWDELHCTGKDVPPSGPPQARHSAAPTGRENLAPGQA